MTLHDLTFPGDAPSLSLPREDEIHVWAAPTDDLRPALEAAFELLSRDERYRAERLVAHGVRQDFILSHGMLRYLLSGYLDLSPQKIDFAAGARGKPFLTNGFMRSALRFNLSHTDGCALFAFAIGREVGIDAEAKRPVRDAVRIAQRYFHPTEAHAVATALPANLDEVFLTCWVRKEAALKAIGVGLSAPPASHCVGTAAYPSSGPLEVPKLDLRIKDVDFGPDHIAAVSWTGTPAVVTRGNMALTK